MPRVPRASEPTHESEHACFSEKSAARAPPVEIPGQRPPQYQGQAIEWKLAPVAANSLVEPDENSKATLQQAGKNNRVKRKRQTSFSIPMLDFLLNVKSDAFGMQLVQ